MNKLLVDTKESGKHLPNPGFAERLILTQIL
jgi:hypothetical protein